MRRSPTTRMRYSRDEWRQIIERFGASGLSEAAFCKRERLSPKRFAQWQRKLPRPRAHSASFVELRPANPIPTSQGEFEITLPGGVSLRWKA